MNDGKLVAEMSHASKYHGDAVLVGSSDDFFITHRAARLDDALDASFGGVVNAITEWEKCV